MYNWKKLILKYSELWGGFQLDFKTFTFTPYSSIFIHTDDIDNIDDTDDPMKSVKILKYPPCK